MNLLLFHQPTRVHISATQLAKAKQFAQKVIDTVDYQDSRQSNRKKILQDHFISKIGEAAVAHIFVDFGLQVKGPDYNIYEGKTKSWEADLYIDDWELAVKTQTQQAAKRYGCSWTFQNSQQRRDPILNDAQAWVCFVLCDTTKAYDCLVYPPFKIKELTFSAPKLSYLQDKKKVVYAKDLPTI
ncbi:MAG: hypothetical protein AAF738_03435 [Bacteroidota bacterium]